MYTPIQGHATHQGPIRRTVQEKPSSPTFIACDPPIRPDCPCPSSHLELTLPALSPGADPARPLTWSCPCPPLTWSCPWPPLTWSTKMPSTSFKKGYRNCGMRQRPASPGAWAATHAAAPPRRVEFHSDGPIAPDIASYHTRWPGWA
jgi:hypothetical protein